MKAVPASIALLAALASAQSRIYTIRGTAGERTGFAVAGLGDLDGDGRAEFAIASPGDDTKGVDAGKVTVVSGISGLPRFTYFGDAAGDEFGWAVAAVGDHDRDGVPDFAVGAPFHDTAAFNAGRVRVYSGKSGSLLRTIEGGGAREIFGIAIAAAGDVNADGFDDLVAGAHGDDINGTNSGSARVVSGKDGKVLWLFKGDAAFDFFGHSVAGIGDIDNDTVPDLLVGAPDDDNAGAQSGTVRVFSGKTGLTLKTIAGVAAGDFFGHSVAAAGDVDKDGTPDFIAGAPQFFVAVPKAGYAKVFSGKDFSIVHTFAGDKAGDFFGEPVRGAGDVDGDGHADLAVGAHRSDKAAADGGLMTVFSGKTGRALLAVAGTVAGGHLGYVVDRAGTVNEDGIADLVIGAPGTASGGAGVVVSPPSLALVTDVHTLSMAAGGKQVMSLDAGKAAAGRIYLVIGSITDTRPGVRFPNNGPLLPLNFDPYMLFTVTGPNLLIETQVGVLDQDGKGTAKFILETGKPKSLVGTRFHHAFIVIDLKDFSVPLASNAVPLTLIK